MSRRIFTLTALLAKVRSGGFVLYLRHGYTANLTDAKKAPIIASIPPALWSDLLHQDQK